ncbi:MAG: hypothetical protein KGH93_03290 [Patescibacteria group bacterium]|nr:hypothetical protein [Patescibacteria group bacterium]
MSLPIYTQYILPELPTISGVLRIRINPHGDIGYDQAATDTIIVDPPNVILSVADLKKQYNDKDGDLAADQFQFHVYDSLKYSGTVNGVAVSEDLTNTNGSLWDNICAYENTLDSYGNYIQPILWAELYHDGAWEPFFCGTIDTSQIPRDHISVFRASQTDEVQTRELEITAIDVMALLKLRTIQQLIDTNDFDGSSTHVNRWYAGAMWLIGTPPDNVAKYDDAGLTGHEGDPYTGLRRMTLLQLITFVANLCHSDTTGLTIDSAFTYYGQTYYAGGGTKYALYDPGPPETFNILINYFIGKGVLNLPRYSLSSVDTTANTITLASSPGYAINTTVVFNANGGTLPSPLVAGTVYYIVSVSGATIQVAATLGGTAIDLTTGYTGSPYLYQYGGDFAYTNSWDRTSAALKILTGLSYQFGCIFYNKIGLVGGVNLPVMNTISRRTKFSDIPSDWILSTSKEEPHYIGKSSVIVQNEFDNLQLLAGNDPNNAVQITMPFRLKQWGAQSPNSNYNDSGYFPDSCLWIDQSLGQYSQYQAFKIETPDGGSFNNPNGWQPSRYLYYDQADVANIYHHSGWTSATEGMMSLAAMQINGFSIPTDISDNYNALRAAALFYYNELAGNRIVLTRKYIGVLGTDGTIQGVRPGMETVLDIRTVSNGGSNRTFRGFETVQSIINGTTEIKFYDRPADYSVVPIPSMRYISGGGITSSSGTSTGTGGSSGGGSGGGSADDPQYVSTIPATNVRNDINAQPGATAAVTLVKGSLNENWFDVDLTGVSSVNDLDISDADGIFYSAVRTSGNSGDVNAITGMKAAADGAMLCIQNDSAYYLYFSRENALSTAANRIVGSTEIDSNGFKVTPYGSINFRYDGTQSRWVCTDIFLEYDTDPLTGYLILVKDTYKHQTLQVQASNPDWNKIEYLLRIAPTSLLPNYVTAGSGAVALALQGNGSQSIFEWYNSSAVKKGYIENAGTLHLLTDFTIWYANPIGIDNGSSIATGGINYILGQNSSRNMAWFSPSDLTTILGGGWVLLAPTSASFNTIQPSADYHNLILKLYASQTVYPFALLNSSGTPLIEMSVNGQLGIGSEPDTTKDYALIITQGTAGHEVYRIVSTATNDDVTAEHFQSRIATTNNTPTTLLTISTASNYVYRVHAKGFARQTGGTAGTTGDTFDFDVDFEVCNLAGTLNQNGFDKHTVWSQYRANVTFVGAGFTEWLVFSNLSGTDILFQFSGEANKNITVHCTDITVSMLST